MTGQAERRRPAWKGAHGRKGINPMTSSSYSTGTRDTPIWGMRPVHIAWLGVALVTLFRFWYMCRYDLVPDEAKYWVCSKHLALCYRDKGPLGAWTIALGTRLFGDTVFGVRFFAVLLSVGTALPVVPASSAIVRRPHGPLVPRCGHDHAAFCDRRHTDDD